MALVTLPVARKYCRFKLPFYKDLIDINALSNR